MNVVSEAIHTPEMLSCEGGWKILAGGRQLQPDDAVLDTILGKKRSLLVLPPDDESREPPLRLAKAHKVRAFLGAIDLICVVVSQHLLLLLLIYIPSFYRII